MDWSPLWISLRTALAATVLAFALGVLAARWRVGYRGAFGSLIDGLFLLPLALPPTVIGLVLLLFFGRHSPVGTALGALGMNVIFSWEATVIAALVVTLPLMYLAARAGFQQIDRELLDVARTFGYSEWRMLWQIMVPLAWPAIVSGIVLCFVRALGEFGATLMLAGNLPGRTQTIPIAVFFQVAEGDYPSALIFSGVILSLSVAAIAVLGRIPIRH